MPECRIFYGAFRAWPEQIVSFIWFHSPSIVSVFPKKGEPEGSPFKLKMG